jgi:hypothetical protein
MKNHTPRFHPHLYTYTGIKVLSWHTVKVKTIILIKKATQIVQQRITNAFFEVLVTSITPLLFYYKIAFA